MAHPFPSGARLGVLTLLLAGAATAVAEPQPATVGEAPAGKQWVYVGTYTGAKSGSKGIYRFDFDPATGHLTPGGLAGEAVNPSFLAIHPDHKHLYAVGEINTF